MGKLNRLDTPENIAVDRDQLYELLSSAGCTRLKKSTFIHYTRTKDIPKYAGKIKGNTRNKTFYVLSEAIDYLSENLTGWERSKKACLERCMEILRNDPERMREFMIQRFIRKPENPPEDAILDAREKKGGRPREKSKITMEDLPSPEGKTEEEYLVSLPQNPDLTDARTFREVYQGKLAQLKYDKEKELLIEKEVVRNEIFSAFRAIRDALLSIPPRMAGELASITSSAELEIILTEEIVKTLEDMSHQVLDDGE